MTENLLTSIYCPIMAFSLLLTNSLEEQGSHNKGCYICGSPLLGATRSWVTGFCIWIQQHQTNPPHLMLTMAVLRYGTWPGRLWIVSRTQAHRKLMVWLPLLCFLIPVDSRLLGGRSSLVRAPCSPSLYQAAAGRYPVSFIAPRSLAAESLSWEHRVSLEGHSQAAFVVSAVVCSVLGKHAHACAHTCTCTQLLVGQF